MVSGFILAVSFPTRWYASIVSAISLCSPLPTSGIINGGCGTINPAVTDMAISPFTGREFSQSPPKYLNRSGRKTGYTYDTYTIAQNPVRAQIPVLYFL